MSRPRLEVLGTRVARRVLTLFTIGAAVPVAVMALLSYVGITGQVREQSEASLSRLTNVVAQSIHERLAGFQSILEATAVVTSEWAPATVADGASPDLPLPAGIEGLALTTAGDVRVLAGSLGELPEPSPDQEARLVQGRPFLELTRGIGLPEVGALMAVPIEGADGSWVLWARITGDSIWAPAVTQASDPSIVNMCIFDSEGAPLHCLAGSPGPLAGATSLVAATGQNAGLLEVASEGDAALVAWRELYLRPSFGQPSWTLALQQSASTAYAAADVFAYNLLLTVLIGLSGALLLTHILVRRTMEPLQALTEGTRQLAGHDLGTRVEVRTGDEFGDLADSFNTMAERLGVQFRQLEAARAIDQAAMTAADHGEAVQALLEGVGDIVPGAHCAVALPEPDLPGTMSVFSLDGRGDPVARDVRVGTDATEAFGFAALESATVEREGDVPEVFRSWVGEGHGLPLLFIPLKIAGDPVGMIAMSSDSADGIGPSDAHRAQRLADQAAVALAKLRLDKELTSMSWEVLRAFAHAIDAKSQWTTGHSERVTGLSLVMGSELGLDSEEMDVLHRGGLLHDIGKIGVPAAVLDYDGTLDDRMRRTMEEHPAAGARILEPIRAFAPILPIVRHHHEWWDGGGYPDGLTGADIHRLARLVAVADVFDAMVSARPYRAALDPTVVLGHIVSGAGTQFDPDMVQTLTRVWAGGWRPQASSGVGATT